MPLSPESPAVAVARAHAHAWSNHDFDAARAGLADDVKVTAKTTNAHVPDTDLTGIDDYMTGLHAFADPIVPGSLHELATIGDEHNALFMYTVEADFGGGKITLPGARLYLLDEDGKIKMEDVVFLVPD